MLDQLREEPGWHGMFTRGFAGGDAYPNGTRVVKIVKEKSDAHAVGATATVLGSFSHPEIMAGAVFYFVEWDDTPRVAVGCMGLKLLRVNHFRAEDYFHIKGRGDVFTGKAPIDYHRDKPNPRYTGEPWVIEFHGIPLDKLWRVTAVESFCIPTTSAGMGIGLIVKEFFGV